MTHVVIAAVLTMVAICSAWTVTIPSLWPRARCWSAHLSRACSRSTQRRRLLCETSSDNAGDRHWHGPMIPFSEYAIHVRVGEEDAPIPILDAIRQSMGERLAIGNCSHVNTRETGEAAQATRATRATLTPQQLLKLGSIWYLPKDHYEHNLLKVQHYVFKNLRLTEENSTLVLEEGDYMRIHHKPRRYTQVYNFDWSEPLDSSQESKSKLPSTIVYSSPEFWIIDKPPLIPVHATVDNAEENVVRQLSNANPYADYVATTQRIDVNTSGLLVVARKPRFAAYFAQLLRWKTKQQKHEENNIVKRYKCLVCIQQNNSESDETIFKAFQRLSDLQNTTIQHYLESSDRAPLRFEPEPELTASSPETAEATVTNQKWLKQKWLECRLTITGISKIYPIPNDQHPLSSGLWSSSRMPESTKAVCEVSIQLETGRTHQIRGQLSRLGFPLVGDELYGGAIPVDQQVSDTPQFLALQSSYVGFWDADYTEVRHERRRKNITQGIPSKRWIEISLDKSWWSPILEQGDADDTITSSEDAELVSRFVSSSPENTMITTEKPTLLPPTVQLSTGQNKYVLVKVESQAAGGIRWFVKSASPQECGGAYHANVAEDLVEWIRSAGFDKVTVTGGGRIDYSPTSKRAHVYGFSYGFGKGDHARAAALIAEAGLISTFDNSNALY